jgi:anti-sigma regulatory factor (Ser/Thr protein kinase)
VNTVGERTVAYVLAADPRSVAEARHAVAKACRLAGESVERCEQMVLLTSELVTNAVLYGRSAVQLVISWAPGHMRVEVGDDNARPPVLRSSDPSAIDGRGLRLVNELADDWGVQHEGDGKHVWFEMRTQPSPARDRQL